MFDAILVQLDGSQRVEAILGITRAGNVLTVNPCIPCDWHGSKVDYRFGTTHYKISVENPHNIGRGALQVVLDGVPLSDGSIPLVDDGLLHTVQVMMK